MTRYVNCTDLTDSQLKSLSLTRGIASIICAIACLVTLVGIFYTRTYRSLNQRLFLYLTVSTLVFLISLALQVESYSSDDTSFCVAVGFLRQFTGFVQLLITFGITLYVFVLIITKLSNFKWAKRDVCPPWSKAAKLKSITIQVFLEVCSIGIPVVLISVVVGLVPVFIHSGYGQNGPWCWIERFTDNCTYDDLGLIEQLGMWFVPFGVVSLFGVFILVLFFAVIVWARFKGGVAWKVAKRIVQQSAVILSFVIAYFLLWCVETAADVLTNKYHTDVYWVSLLFAILTPVSGAIPAVTFLFHEVYTKYYHKPNRRFELSHPVTQAATYAPPSSEDDLSSETNALYATSIGMESERRRHYGAIQSQDEVAVVPQADSCCGCMII